MEETGILDPEQLVKESGWAELQLRFADFLHSLFAFFLVLLMPFLMILPVLLIVLDVFLFRRLDLEYSICM